MSPARVEYSKQKSFILQQDETLSRLDKYNELPVRARQELENLYIVGTEGGFKLDSHSGRGGWTLYFLGDHAEDGSGFPEGHNVEFLLGKRKGKNKNILVLSSGVRITPIDNRTKNIRLESLQNYIGKKKIAKAKLKEMLKQKIF